jgi:hypothetical protein
VVYFANYSEGYFVVVPACCNQHCNWQTGVMQSVTACFVDVEYFHVSLHAHKSLHRIRRALCVSVWHLLLESIGNFKLMGEFA